MVLKYKVPYPLALAAGGFFLMASWQLWGILRKPTPELLVDQAAATFDCRKIDTSSALTNTADLRRTFYELTDAEAEESEAAGDDVVCLAKQRKTDKK